MTVTWFATSSVTATSSPAYTYSVGMTVLPKAIIGDLPTIIEGACIPAAGSCARSVVNFTGIRAYPVIGVEGRDVGKLNLQHTTFGAGENSSTAASKPASFLRRLARGWKRFLDFLRW